MNIIGLVARQSTDYVDRFFDHLLRGDIVVPLRSADDQYRIAASGVTEIVDPSDGHGWIEAKIDFPSEDALAQIAFTSGTEGEPKGVLLTSANLATTVERIRDAMQINASIREYVGVPVYHSFGFGRCRLVASVGGKAFIPPGGFNPREIASMLSAGEINAISAVPSLWRITLQNAHLFADCGQHVRWIEIGSQAMSADEKRAMRKLFPNARIVQHYGLTEASRSTFLDISNASDQELESVGAPNGDVEISISDSGRIRIRGSHVAEQLLVGGKKVSNLDADGWLTTSDLGQMHNNVLYFHGRADDVINCGGIKLAPDRLEDTLKSQLALGGGIAVAKVPDPTRGDGILIAVRHDVSCSDSEIIGQATSALLEHGINPGSSLHLIRLEELPVTDTGKIRRSELAEIFADSDAAHADNAPEPDLLARIMSMVTPQQPKTVRALFTREFPGVTIKDGDSFVGLGGDSLSFVNVSITLEEMLGQLPNNWQNMPVDELDSIRPRERFLHPVDTSLFMRFIGIIAVVTGHLSSIPVGGATFLLLATGGFNFARFQLPNILDRNSVVPVLMTTMRLAVPLLLMIAALQLRQQDMRPFEFTLLMNWLPAEGQSLDFWFIEFMVQMFLIMAVLLAIPAVRGFARARPQVIAWTLLAVGVVAATLMPFIWDTSLLYDRVPHMLFWLFALGWVIQLTTTLLLRAAVILLVFALPLLTWGPYGEVEFWIANGQLWVWGGCLILLFFDRIPVPWPLNKLAFWIGGASMMIYIVHWQVFFNWQRLGLIDNDFVDIAVAILGGVVCWWLWEKLTRFVAERFAGRSSRAPVITTPKAGSAGLNEQV